MKSRHILLRFVSQMKTSSHRQVLYVIQKSAIELITSNVRYFTMQHESLLLDDSCQKFNGKGEATIIFIGL
jgi:hypothetical protein